MITKQTIDLLNQMLAAAKSGKAEVEKLATAHVIRFSGYTLRIAKKERGLRGNHIVLTRAEGTPESFVVYCGRHMSYSGI